MVEIRVKPADIENEALAKAAEIFKVTIIGAPTKEELKESAETMFTVTIVGIIGNIHSFLSNTVDKERNLFNGMRSVQRFV